MTRDVASPDVNTAAGIGKTASDGVPTWQRRDPVSIDPVQYKAWCDDKLAEMMSAPLNIQRSESDGGVEQQPGDVQHEPVDVQQTAADGIAGPGSSLPHGDAIQAAFGHHDVSGVQAHVGSAAADASAAMGARAYATGNHVAFGSAPDLHLAAHEAAHVVQQRGGVQLKAGVGQAGDRYEEHADAVAERVVRGESAASLLDQMAGAGIASSVVQCQAANRTVDVTVAWTSPFGNNLSGKVTLQGSSDQKAWKTLASLDVVNDHGITFQGVAHYSYYRATISPADDVPGDRQDVGQFERTTTDPSSKVAPGAATARVGDGLELNRWNRDNVRQRHVARGIDPAKAGNVHAQSLFGRSVQVHDLLAPRVMQTDALYQALSPTTKAEIDASIFVTGGLAYRNRVGKQGSFSNHSIGSAVDVNYNEVLKQNALMDDNNELAILNKLVEPVVKSDPAHGNFDVWKSKGVDQLEASRYFRERFPSFLAELLRRPDDVNRLASAEALPWGNQLETATIESIFSTVTKSVLEAAEKAEPSHKKKVQLQLIARNWESLQAWVLGAAVTDQHAGQRDGNGHRLPTEQKTALGMIPLDERVLKMFLDSGWQWGGDWTKTKDYMHFEDPSIEGKL